MQHVGQYEVVRELGRGGMGVVYLARAPGASREVALKLVLEQDRTFLARFRREGQALRFLGRHANIIGLLDLGEDQGRAFLVMDYVDGGETLSDALKTGALSSAQGVKIAVKIARALHFAHEAGFVHRDVKPSNILVDPEGAPFLADFGLAKHTRDERLTQTGQLLGSPAYMAPEQVEAAQSVDRRSDIYALGATLYHVLCGQPPFQGSQLSVIKAVLIDLPVPPRKVRAGVDPRLEAVCLRALAKDPADRFETAEAFAQALEDAPSTAPRRDRRVPAWTLAIASAISLVLVAGLLLSRSQAQARAQANAQANAEELSRLSAERALELEQHAKALEAAQATARLSWRGEPLAAATALLEPLAEVKAVADLEQAFDVSRRILGALRSELSTVNSEPRYAELLLDASRVLLASVDPSDPKHVVRVRVAHDCLASYRILRPKADLSDAVATLRALGEAPVENIRVAARPYLRFWHGDSMLLPKADVERALGLEVDPADLDKIFVTEVDRLTNEHPPKNHGSFPVPWGAVLNQLRAETNWWERNPQLEPRYQAMIGFLIERPDLPFLWFWSASAASALGRREEVRGLVAGAAPQARTCEELFFYARILLEAGCDEEAAALCEANLEKAKVTKDHNFWQRQLYPRVLLELERPADALVQLETIGKLFPRTAVKDWMQSFLRARALRALGDVRAAAVAELTARKIRDTKLRSMTNLRR